MATRQKIRYSDCDPQGIVFNGNYPRYWDDALTDWYAECGYAGEELGGSGVDILTARIEIDFKAPASLGDELETVIEVERWGNTSMTIAINTHRLSDGELCVTGKEVIVYVDPADFRPVPVPESIKDTLSRNSPSNR